MTDNTETPDFTLSQYANNADRLDAMSDYIKELEATIAALTEQVRVAAIQISKEQEIAVNFQKENDKLRQQIEAAQKQEPVAWLHENNKHCVISGELKKIWLDYEPCYTEPYNIPLYAHPIPKETGK
jgi:hypothetical protein